MTTYTIAYYHSRLLACCPDGEDIEGLSRDGACCEDLPETIEFLTYVTGGPRPVGLIVESGLTLVHETAPGDDIRWTSVAPLYLKDDDCWPFEYAVRRN